MKIVSSLIAAALLLVANGANAGARDALDTFSKGLRGLDGQFSQQVFDVRGKQKESSSGRVALSAPNQLRWEYIKPYAQLVVADGKTVWVYEPDLNQATKRAQGVEEANSPLALLLTPARLVHDFMVKESPVQAGVEWLDITPRNADAGFKSARLGFAQGQLVHMEYTDALGQRTTIAFTSWKRNPVFAKGTFTYVPAKGVDVIGG